MGAVPNSTFKPFLRKKVSWCLIIDYFTQIISMVNLWRWIFLDSERTRYIKKKKKKTFYNSTEKNPTHNGHIFCSEPPPAVPSFCHELHEESKIASEIEFETRPNVPFRVRQKDLKASFWNCWSRQYTEQDTLKTAITTWISDQLPERNPHIVQMYYFILIKMDAGSSDGKSLLARNPKPHENRNPLWATSEAYNRP